MFFNKKHDISAQFTLSQSGGLRVSTPCSDLMPYGFGMCGQVYLHIRLINYELMCGRATTARVATALQCDQLDMMPSPICVNRCRRYTVLSHWHKTPMTTYRVASELTPTLHICALMATDMGQAPPASVFGFGPTLDGVVLHTRTYCFA